MNRIRGRGESKRRVSLPCRRARFSPTIRLGEFLTCCEIVLRTFSVRVCPIWLPNMAWGMAADVPLEQPLALVPAGTVGERWWDRAWVDLLLVVPVLVVAWLAELPGDSLSRSFWLDEGWVADSVRAPLGQLRLLTSSTPIGWTLLLRLVPHVGPPERLRLLPMGFAVAAALAGWLLGRQFGRVQGLLVGLAVAVVPGMRPGNAGEQHHRVRVGGGAGRAGPAGAVAAGLATAGLGAGGRGRRGGGRGFGVRDFRCRRQ